MTDDAYQNLVPYLAEAWQRNGVTVTLRRLLGSKAEDGQVLEYIRTVVAFCDTAKLEFAPGIDFGDLDTPRVLRPIASPDELLVTVKRELELGEGVQVEFKASMHFDWKRAANDPTATPSDLKSEKVLESVLKSICGFLNADGGSLLIGVTDSGEICGIEADCSVLGIAGTRSELKDKWELNFRELVRSRFHDGSSIERLLNLGLVTIGERTVARVRVSPRSGMTCVKWGGRYETFVRRGNATRRLELSEVQEFVVDRVCTSMSA